MKVCGIVTEYNPMHIGHSHQLQEAKALTHADGTILVMSGNFVQRGEPAIIEKYARARAAVDAGVDLVIELPVLFATASAEYFSTYAIRLLDATGIVTHLNFGSESGQIEALDQIAQLLSDEPLGFRVLINDALKEGLSYPKARQKALLLYSDHHDLFPPEIVKEIEQPNNILGIEYLKALKRISSPIEATTIQRIGADYHNTNSTLDVPSATSIREHLKKGLPLEALQNKMPSPSYKAIAKAIQSGVGPIYTEDMFHSLRHTLLHKTPTELATFVDISEGLENRIKKSATHSFDYETLINNILTKRYTRTRIARALLHVYLGHQKELFNHCFHHMPPYLKVLAFNKTGQHLMKAIRQQNEDLPLIVNNRQGFKQLSPLQQQCFMADTDSTLMYNHLIAMKYGAQVKNEYQMKIVPNQPINSFYS